MKPVTPNRMLVMLGAALCGVLVVVALNAAPLPPLMAKFLVDKGVAINPYAIQNAMWVVFAIGLGEILFRVKHATMEYGEVDERYLPEDEKTILTLEDMPGLYRNIKKVQNHSFLSRLIPRVILQFQSSRSIEQSTTVLNASLELFQHEIDLRYNVTQYINWLIPSLGFIGTVYGIAMTLATAGGMKPDDPELLAFLTRDLSVAFYTTLLALLMSATLMFLKQLAMGREEGALNQAGQYCLDNLINRLYIPASADSRGR